MAPRRLDANSRENQAELPLIENKYGYWREFIFERRENPRLNVVEQMTIIERQNS